MSVVAIGRGQLLVHDLPDAGDRLVGRPLGREALDRDPVDDLALEPPQSNPPRSRRASSSLLSP